MATVDAEKAEPANESQTNGVEIDSDLQHLRALQEQHGVCVVF